MSAIPPGTCGIHGYHGRTACPHCSTSALPFTPLLSQPEHLTLPGLRAENEQLRRERQQAQQEADALRAERDELGNLEETRYAENCKLRYERQQAIDALREIDAYIAELALPGPETDVIQGIVDAAFVKLGEKP